MSFIKTSNKPHGSLRPFKFNPSIVFIAVHPLFCSQLQIINSHGHERFAWVGCNETLKWAQHVLSQFRRALTGHTEIVWIFFTVISMLVKKKNCFGLGVDRQTSHFFQNSVQPDAFFQTEASHFPLCKFQVANHSNFSRENRTLHMALSQCRTLSKSEIVKKNCGIYSLLFFSALK